MTDLSGIADAAATVDAAVLAAPNPLTPSQAGFPTVGDFVPYLFTGHFAYHIGQLVIWLSALEAAGSAHSGQRHSA